MPFSKSASFLLISTIPIATLSLTLISNNYRVIFEWTLGWLGRSCLPLTLIIDPVGVTTSATVIFIAGNVIIFSKTYISEEIFKSRFNGLVILFVLSMNILIFIPNLIILLISWDGLGIISFLLVIYYQRPKALSAGIITANGLFSDGFQLWLFEERERERSDDL